MAKKLFLFLFLSLALSSTHLWAADGPAAADDKKDAAPPAKDVLIFSNGDQLTGEFVGTTGGTVTFKSDMAGQITVPWDKIKELRSNGRYAVLEEGFKQKGTRKLNDAKVPKGTVTMQDQTVSIHTDSGPPQTVPVKDADFVVDAKTYEKEVTGKPSFFADWDGAITAGGTLVRATQNSETFTGAVNLVRSVPDVTWLDPRSRTTVDFTDNYGKVTQAGQDAIKTSIYHADAEHDIYFTPTVYVLGQAAFDHNYSQGLDLQQIYGGGIGWTVFKRPNSEFDVKGQVQYEVQSFGVVPGTTGPAVPDENLFASTFAEAYTYKWKNNIVFNESIQAIPAWNVLDAYSGIGQAGVLMPLYKRFNFTLQVLDNYLGDPAPGAQKNSFQTVVGITYKLR
jgi:hypothetical protein